MGRKGEKAVTRGEAEMQTEHWLEDAKLEFRRMKRQAEKALAQVEQKSGMHAIVMENG